jgi:protein-S-isoprenylcysteine O-methyltransferase Ste14
MLRFKQIAGIVFNVGIFAAILFIPAGTIHWPRAWIFLGVVLVGTTYTIFAIPEDLLNERFKLPIQRSQPIADGIVTLLLIVAFFGVIALMLHDVLQLHLMRPPAFVVSLSGLVLFAAGWWLLTAAMVENRFATPVVKYQPDRGHRVIDTGPYRMVRHPMYSGGIAIPLGMALWFGSYAAAIACLIPIAVLAVRITIEERFLCRNLPGYKQYMSRTNYRLIPYVW